jgi:hypothetical protein
MTGHAAATIRRELTLPGRTDPVGHVAAGSGGGGRAFRNDLRLGNPGRDVLVPASAREAL